MKTTFRQYLIAKGYKTETPNGRPSTVDDYIGRIDFVCDNEGFSSWKSLADNMTTILNDYDRRGEKQNLGDRSHRAVINALKRFSEFLKMTSNS